MVNKVMGIEEAIGDLKDGATILIGGFSTAGTPHNLIAALSERGLKNLTLVANSYNQFIGWSCATGVVKIITSFALPPFSGWRTGPVTEAVRDRKIEVEIVPQGTLAERIRNGGAGIPAFYSPVGVGTVLEEGREKRVFRGKECLLELAIRADISLIKADKADRLGNLVYRKAQRNFNPIMASAADLVIAEVDEIVEVGALDPDRVVTPGIYVDRVVQMPKRMAQYR